MRVLITRPEREAATLAAALSQRGHEPVIAPLFRLQLLAPPADFAPALAACQAVLLTSVNGARALAAASEQRSKPVLAVGDTTASTAEGLGFSDVSSAAGDAAALTDLVRNRLDPKKGPLVHVSGVDVAGEFAEALGPAGFEVRRFALYDARAVDRLPDAARVALQARTAEVATFFSPRSAELFVRLAVEAGLAEACRGLAAVAISPAAALPLKALPFRAVRVAAQTTRQAVLDEIDRLVPAVVQEPQPRQQTMSDTPTSPSPPSATPAPAAKAKGLGVVGAFVSGAVAAFVVLAGALVSLPYWPEPARELWRGPPLASSVSQAELAQQRAQDQAQRQAETTAQREARARTDADVKARLDDLDKRVRAAAETAAQADRPTASDPAIAELRARITALEARPAGNPDADRELAALKSEVDALRDNSAAEQKALAAARASALIGIAARLSAALDSGLPFASDLELMKPLAKDDAKLGDCIVALQPHAATGVASRTALTGEFPGVAKASLSDDLADDSFGERLLGKLKALVSLRRVGADVPGDTTEAKLARAEAALGAGDIAKAVEIVKSLSPQAARATSSWLASAESLLAAQRAVDQLSAYAVALLGTSVAR